MSRGGTVAQVNRALAALGFPERIIKARGYHRLSGGLSHTFRESGFYGYGVHGMNNSTVADVLESVARKFAENDRNGDAALIRKHILKLTGGI